MENTINTKSELINYLGKKYNYQSYLEISTMTTGIKFDKIDNDIFKVKDLFLYYPNELQIIDEKEKRKDIDAVPETYYSCFEKFKDNKYDIILVDPFHTFEQSKTDIETAMKLISQNGIIVVHDCLPTDESIIGPYKHGSWCGQTYEAFVDFKINNPNIQTYVVDIDYGCGIIINNSIRNIKYCLQNNMILNEVVKWDYFYYNRKEILDLITINEFKILF